MGFGASILSTLKGQISDLKNITSNKLPELKKLASQGKDVFPQLEKLDKLITTTEKTCLVLSCGTVGMKHLKILLCMM